MLIDAAVTFDSGYNPTEKLPENAQAVDSAKIQGETLIEGGYIKTVYLEAEFAKIDTLDLTDTTLTTNSVKEGGADETIDHITASTYSLSDKEVADNYVTQAVLNTETESFLSSASITKHWDDLVYSLDVDYDDINGETFVKDVRGLTVTALGDISFSTDSDPAVVEGFGTYVSDPKDAALTDIEYVNKDVLISVSE